MTEALSPTFLQPLHSYAVRTFPLRTLRTLVTQILLRVLYVGSIRTMWLRFRPVWSDVVISRTAFRMHFLPKLLKKKFQYRSYKQIRHVVMVHP